MPPLCKTMNRNRSCLAEPVCTSGIPPQMHPVTPSPMLVSCNNNVLTHTHSKQISATVRVQLFQKTSRDPRQIRSKIYSLTYQVRTLTGLACFRSLKKTTLAEFIMYVCTPDASKCSWISWIRTTNWYMYLRICKHNHMATYKLLQIWALPMAIHDGECIQRILW